MHTEGVVLVVEDEVAVRDLMLHHLYQVGMRAEPVLRPGDLLDRIARGGVSYVVLDIHLGDGVVSGVDLFRQIRGQYPDMLIMFLTGYSDLAKDHPDVALLSKTLLATKPFDPREFVRLIKTEIRNRCRDLQQEKTLEQLDQALTLGQETHDVICEVRDAIRHPETGLAATHTLAKDAAQRDVGQILTDSFKKPLQKALLGLVALLGGVVVTMCATMWKLIATGAVKP